MYVAAGVLNQVWCQGAWLSATHARASRLAKQAVTDGSLGDVGSAAQCEKHCFASHALAFSHGSANRADVWSACRSWRPEFVIVSASARVKATEADPPDHLVGSLSLFCQY